MHFSNNEIATYLFCAPLTQTKTIPLTIIEWNIIVKSLRNQSLQPESLFKISLTDLEDVLINTTGAQKKRILKKIENRQQLGLSMFELENMNNQGYRIMFRSQMPAKLKKLTAKFLPPFFYYAGDPSILQNNILGVVGAREANKEELQKTSEISRQAAEEGVVIASGGAKGIDTCAVDSALNNGGKAIIFPAEGLEKWIKKHTIRKYISNNQLLLMSTQKLNAPFTGHYAMNRNKYIHAPSDAVLVGSSKISGSKKSGTWEGVLENIKHKWSALYVIGHSEGAEKLKTENLAQPFSTVASIYNAHNSNTEENASEINEKIVSLVKLAQSKGLDQKKLDDKFKEISAYFYSHNAIDTEENKSEVIRESNDFKQLSMEDYSSK